MTGNELPWWAAASAHAGRKRLLVRASGVDDFIRAVPCVAILLPGFEKMQGTLPIDLIG
ncbi:unnamed protein product, partial [Closterium sp. NIES-53]